MVWFFEAVRRAVSFLAACRTWPFRPWIALVHMVFLGAGNSQPQTQTCISKHLCLASDQPLQFCGTFCSSKRARGSACELRRHSWPWLPSKQFMLGSNREISYDKDAITGWQMWNGAEWAAFVQTDPGWECWDYCWLGINGNWWFICSSETSQVHPSTPSPISLRYFFFLLLQTKRQQFWELFKYHHSCELHYPQDKICNP